MPAGQDYTCTWNNPPLKMGEKTVLGVQINVPDNMAKEFNCKIKNIAKISHAPGGSNQNTNPADDEATAIADVPQEICDSSVPRSNLKLEKTLSRIALAGPCKNNADWCKAFVIVVKNTGPNQFNGQIAVTDIAPAGVNIQSIGGNDWTCAFTTCTTNKAVKLDKNPPSTDGIGFHVMLSGTAAQAKAMNCKLTNKAKINSPLGAPKNVNAADDQDQVTVDLDPKFCRGSTIPSNLRLDKHAQTGVCEFGGNGWQCDYTVTATNTGPGIYTGLLEVEDTLQVNGGGVTMDAVLPPAYGWVCADNGPASKRCSIANANLAVNGTVDFHVRAVVPLSYPDCFLENKARIVEAQGGTLKNSNAGDDNASASAQFAAAPAGAASKCGPRIEPQCPPGFRWDGDSCDRIGITTLPPVRLCPTGSVGRYPDCDPVTDDDPDCPPGMVGEYPNCRTVDPKCPPGSVGNYPNCRTIVDPKCPAGTVGKYPNCRDKPDGSTPECTDGRVRRGSTCVCPGSLVWNGDQCVRRKCPEGMRGTFPNCTKVIVDPPKCKPGTVGRWPNCEKIVKICPAGTVGKYPNCRKIPTRCPSGMSGKPPRCYPIVKVCPPGMVGRPPNCKRKPLKLERPQRFQNFQKFQKPSFGQGLRGRPNSLRLR